MIEFWHGTSASPGGPWVIEKILPADAACAEAFTDPPEGLLFPEEAAAVAEAVEKRRREFTTGRMCARGALGRLGVPPAPIPRGESGAPRWPSGIVGSITHCAGYRGAAVARARDMLTIGIDAEPDDPLPDGVLDAVSLAGERARLRDLAARIPGTSWDRLLFSAKESVYKAWFPLAGRWLDFADADITIDPAAGTFDARLLVAFSRADGIPVTGFAGAWLACDGLIVTAIAVPAPPAPFAPLTGSGQPVGRARPGRPPARP
jgi:4'-phosphopantetheinyl transferase EntD